MKKRTFQCQYEKNVPASGESEKETTERSRTKMKVLLRRTDGFEKNEHERQETQTSKESYACKRREIHGLSETLCRGFYRCYNVV